jgi:hypothetical protein
MKAAVKYAGTFNATICKWEAKPKTDQTFTKFCPFFVKEFSKAPMRKQTSQATGYGIANNTKTTNPFNDNTANLVLKTTAKLINAITHQNNKKLDELIKLQTETLTTF